MKIAVMMSTYNGEKYIREQIDSILSQKGEFSLALIVRDDGSQDNTISILKDYEDKGLLKLYCDGQNLGPARSFMSLFMSTRDYDYYAFSDQDDYWCDNKIQKGIDAIKSEKQPALFFSNGELVDERLKYLGRNIFRKTPPINFESMIINGGPPGCTMLWNEELAQIIREKGIPELMWVHDLYVVRVASAIGKIKYCDDCLIKYRQHGSNVIGIKTKKAEALKDRVNRIIKKNEKSIVDYLQVIEIMYKKEIQDDKISFVESVIGYKKSLYSRLKIATNSKVSYLSWSIAFAKRVSFLLGNM